ncbi:MAG: glycosyltransferase [Heteroscytonema crispum UTEX LB 1556]
MALISVIIPVYNGEKTICKTIESVLNQTFTDLELIVVNDGSQDSTLDIVKSISDSRLQLFLYPNAGQAISRNRGIKQASGEYISFIDADDLWTPDKLECQLAALQDHPEASVAYSWCNHIDVEGKFLRPGSRIIANGNVYPQLLVANFLENGSNPLIRRQALTEVGEFEASLSPAEDWDLWLRLAANCQFITVSSPQVLYRVSASSASSNINRMELVSLQVIERAFSQAPKSLQHLKRYSLANLYKYLLYKVLECSPEPKTSKKSVRFLWNAVNNDPSLLQSKTFYKVLCKIVVINLLNPQQARLLLTKLPQISNTSTLLNYIKFESF